METIKLETTGTKHISNKDFQEYTVKWTERYTKDLDKQLFIITTGLAGEAGEVVDLIKKSVRDDKEVDRENLLLELGDVLHYLTIMAIRFGFDLEQIMQANIEKLEKRKKNNV